MDKKTMGAFLAALRKANGMTQQEVADILNVSNKTVSKWERDEGCPEIMMLPAIAELFSVTVDEILRGERVIREDVAGTDKNIRAEKRARYLFEKASTKLTNFSIISIALGAVATIISCIMGNFSYDKTLIVCIFAIILSAASIIVEGIALNSFFSSIKSECIEFDVAETDKTKRKAALFLSAVITMVIAVILCTTVTFIYYSYFLFVISLLLSALAFPVIYSVIKKKFSLGDEEMSDEFRLYRKKHIKITAVIIAVSILATAVFPFVSAALSQDMRNEFCFLYGVGYQYDTDEKAINDYYKLKNFFENNDKLYTLINEYPVENGYRLIVDEIRVDFSRDKNGYQVIGDIERTMYINESAYKSIDFDTYEQAQKYIYENVVDFYTVFGSLKKDIRFDDETYTVSSGIDGDYMTKVADIASVAVLICCIAATAELLISVAIYFKKKKASKV